MARSQIFRVIDIDMIEVRLSNPETPEAIVEEFYRFGTLLFSEILQRGAEVDRKLTIMLGWSLAMLSFLLFNQTKYAQSWERLMVLAAAILSLFCVVLAAFALKTKMWPAPSENDWFKEQLWDDPSMMKRYHIVSMLTTHQTHMKNVKMKADCLGWIEILISISALAIFSVLLFS